MYIIPGINASIDPALMKLRGKSLMLPLVPKKLATVEVTLASLQ
jgi:hypothetical protein